MNDDDLCFADATALATLVRTKAASPVEIIEAHLRRIARVGAKINAVVTLLDEPARAAAQAAEAAVMRGDALGAFHGVPFSIKDSIDTASIVTQRGSLLFAGRVPAHDATVVARMRRAGAIALMKTNCPEFSMWWETDNHLTGRTNNPWDLERTPGGSSGGESAAIAAGLSPVGLGSDVGISVRGPAALTGIVALKATHGAIPCTGLFPRAPSRMWHVGPMARSVRDVAAAFHVLRGADGRDPYAIHAADAGPADPRPAGAPVRVGWLVAPGFGPVAAEVARAIEDVAARLASLGCVVEPVRVPILEEIDGTKLAGTSFSEFLPELREIVGGREGELTAAGKRNLGRREPSFAEHVAAQAEIERLKSAFAGYFQSFDVLLCPVIPFLAPRHGEETYDIDGTRVPTAQMMRATIPFNLTGLPALSVPFRFSAEGLPIAVQLVGRWFDEATVLRLGALVEASGEVRGRRPPLEG